MSHEDEPSIFKLFLEQHFSKMQTKNIVSEKRNKFVLMLHDAAHSAVIEEYKESIKIYEAALSLLSNDPYPDEYQLHPIEVLMIQFSLCLCYVLGNIKQLQAIEMLTEIEQGYQYKQPAVHYLLGKAYFDNNNYELALSSVVRGQMMLTRKDKDYHERAYWPGTLTEIFITQPETLKTKLSELKILIDKKFNHGTKEKPASSSQTISRAKSKEDVRELAPAKGKSSSNKEEFKKNTSAKNTQTVLVNVASKQTQTQATKQTKSRLVQTDKQKNQPVPASKTNIQDTLDRHGELLAKISLDQSGFSNSIKQMQTEQNDVKIKTLQRIIEDKDNIIKKLCENNATPKIDTTLVVKLVKKVLEDNKNEQLEAIRGEITVLKTILIQAFEFINYLQMTMNSYLGQQCQTMLADLKIVSETRREDIRIKTLFDSEIKLWEDKLKQISICQSGLQNKHGEFFFKLTENPRIALKALKLQCHCLSHHKDIFHKLYIDSIYKAKNNLVQVNWNKTRETNEVKSDHETNQQEPAQPCKVNVASTSTAIPSNPSSAEASVPPKTNVNVASRSTAIPSNPSSVEASVPPKTNFNVASRSIPSNPSSAEVNVPPKINFNATSTITAIPSNSSSAEVNVPSKISSVETVETTVTNTSSSLENNSSNGVQETASKNGSKSALSFLVKNASEQPSAPSPTSSSDWIELEIEKLLPRTLEMGGPNFWRLVVYLKMQIPNEPEENLVSAVEEVRNNNNGKLSGLSRETILGLVRSEVQKRKSPKQVWNVTALENQWNNTNYNDCCAICYEDMRNGTVVMLLCKHKFHTMCIRTWLQRQAVCPLCRMFAVSDELYPPLK